MVHKIAVAVEKDSIKVAPDTLTMSIKDEVRWEGANARRFSIAFADAGPFARRDLPHEVAIGQQRPQKKGRFKYSVISADDPKVKLDPVIIVEDPPTGPNP